MKREETRLLRQLAARLRALAEDMLKFEASLLKRPRPLHESHRRSARNLAHYLVLRRHDLRDLQAQLAMLGLSSLGRTESHVLSAILAVYRVLGALVGSDSKVALRGDPPIKMGEGSRLLDGNTQVLLGKTPAGRKVRIMVTMPTEGATDYKLVRDLVQSGMDCMRINCAHDDAQVWLAMIRNLERARKETKRACRVEMDLAGPKLRTGPIEPGVAVVRCRPVRDELGRVTRPARVWLTPAEKNQAAPAMATASLQLPQRFLAQLRRGDRIELRDARNSSRSLRIVKVQGENRLAELRHTAYFVPGLLLHAVPGNPGYSDMKRMTARIAPFPAAPQKLLLKPGEVLVLTRSDQPGRPAVRNRMGQVRTPARIGISLPEFLKYAKRGDSVWFDDGKIGGVIRLVNATSVRVEITQARPEGEFLGESKGINLPDTRIDMPALTDEDIANLKFAVQHADLVGYSFVRTEDDVHQLVEHLRVLKGESLGIILKIETREAFQNLPALMLAAMAMRAVGVMIARGDLAVECGYQRMAEVQEEILWICEAAHVPVVWATQVLESLSKKGIPSRSEITDAAMGERAECVMLNKGPFVVQAVKALDDILQRMQDHQEKKRSMLRSLRIASSFTG